MYIKNSILRFFTGIIAGIAILAVMSLIVSSLLVASQTLIDYIVFGINTRLSTLPAYPVLFITGLIGIIICVIYTGVVLGNALFDNKHENE